MDIQTKLSSAYAYRLIGSRVRPETLIGRNQGSIPYLHGGNSAVIAQNIQCAGMKQKMPATARRKTEPSGYQHSENVTMSK
jgi:hypothetical protein